MKNKIYMNKQTLELKTRVELSLESKSPVDFDTWALVLPHIVDKIKNAYPYFEPLYFDFDANQTMVRDIQVIDKPSEDMILAQAL